MKQLLLLTFIMHYSFSAFSMTSGGVDKMSEEDAQAQAKAIMGNVYDSFLKVIPYVYSDSTGGDVLVKNPAKKEELLKNLTDISDFFQTAKHVQFFQRPGFRPSLDTINSHIADTISSVQSNNFNFAQKRMKAMTALCVSCHSQLPESVSKNAFGTSVQKASRATFESDYAFANYLFLIRRFEDSEKYFDLALDSALNRSDDHILYDSLRKLMSIHTKINFNFKKASNFIEKYNKDKRLPILAKNTLKSWEESLKNWGKFDPVKVKSTSQFIATYLSPLEAKSDQGATGANDINLLVSSGVLTKFLTDNPKSPLVPEVLYWLSIAERRLSSSYFFSLSDLYLKDCVMLHPKSKFALKCYNLYAENIEFGFSGSGGTDIPDGEKRELQKLKNYLKL